MASQPSSAGPFQVSSQEAFQCQFQWEKLNVNSSLFQRAPTAIPSSSCSKAAWRGQGDLTAEPAQHPPAHTPALSLGQNMDAVFIFDLCQAKKEIHFLQLLISEV